MFINPEIRTCYTLSLRTFLQGSRLGARRTVAGIFVLVSQIIGCLGAVLLIAISVIDAASGHTDLVKPLLPLLVLAILLIVFPTATRFISYRNLRGNLPELRMQFEADGSGFRRTIENVGDASWRWDATHGIVANSEVVTIVVRKGAFVFIPRGALTDAEFVRLNEMFCRAKGTC